VLFGWSAGAFGGASSSYSLSFAGAGIVANVVFPTGIDRRDDLGSPDRFDVYYGMADNRIGVARLDVPKHLPSDGLKDLPQAKL
jgi:hypothetical protein